MNRFLFDTATTLNGWIADEQNSLDWLFAVEGGAEPDASLVPQNATVLVEGATTYQWVLEHEDILAHPEKWRNFHGDRPTFVFTTRALPVPEGADVRFVSGAVTDALPASRSAAGDGDVWIVGGGELAGQFLDAGALDEIAVSIAPVLLNGEHRSCRGGWSRTGSVCCRHPPPASSRACATRSPPPAAD